MTSQELKTMDNTYVANTYDRFDLCLERGKGATCWSPEGKEYIDFSSGIGVNSLGLCDDGWVEAVCAQASRLQHTSNLLYSEPCALLAKALCERTGMKKVFFANSGAEANEGAIKAARKYSFDKYGTGRDEILALENSFHGRTMATLSATGQDAFHNFFFPFLEGFRFVPSGDLAKLKQAAGEKTCAVMLELIQGEGGVIAQDADYVRGVEAFCRERDLLLVIDEVQTGIGRTGKLLASQCYGIRPDIVTVAKALGGGLPIGGVLFGEKTRSTLKFGDHGSTFGGNPVVCAGGLAVLKKLDDAMLGEIAEKGGYFRERLAAMPGVKAVSGLGMMIGVTVEGTTSKEVVKAAIRGGLIVLTAKEKVRLLPPLTITYAEIDKGLSILQQAISA